MNRIARYWRYDGNHPHGHDCERYDPHNFGLSLIVILSLWGDREIPLTEPLTDDDVNKIQVIHHKSSSSFGHEVTVSAPKDVWLKGKQALANFCVKYGL